MTNLHSFAARLSRHVFVGDAIHVPLVILPLAASPHPEGLEPPLDWSEDDYAAVDETLIRRIYLQPVQGDLKWLWFLQTVPAPAPNQGVADTLEEPRGALAARYQQIKRGE